MVPGRKTKIMLYVPDRLVKAYTVLAERSGTTRSELIRGVLEQGLAAAQKRCERTEKLSEVGGLGGDLPFRAASRPRGRPPSPAKALAAYVKNLLTTSPHLGADQVRQMVEAQAIAVGVPADERASTVAVVCQGFDDLFASEAAAEAPGDGDSEGLPDVPTG